MFNAFENGYDPTGVVVAVAEWGRRDITVPYPMAIIIKKTQNLKYLCVCVFEWNRWG
jgi:hypothetical protein